MSNSTIPSDVANAQAQANPANYANRYDFNVWENTITAKNQTGETPPYLQRMQLLQEGNTLTAYIPPLATGSLDFTPSNNLGIVDGWGGTHDVGFAQWDSLLTQRNPKYNIIMAHRWWERDPIVYKCVDLLTKWANSEIKFESEDDNAAMLIEKWYEQAMPVSFRESVYLEIFRTAYVPIIKTLIQYQPRAYKYNKIPLTENNNVQQIAEQQASSDNATLAIIEKDAAKMQEVIAAMRQLGEMRDRQKQGLCSADRIAYYEQQLAFKQATWKKGFIPGSYTTLSPLVVDIKGPKEMEWLREPYLNISNEFADAIRNPKTPKQEDLAQKLPLDISLQIRNGKTNEIRLDDNICTVLYGDKASHEPYPTPIVRHAFEALDLKYELKAMDRQTIRTVKNRILLVTVGNDMFPVFDPGEINRVRQAFNSGARTMTLFWNHTIVLKWVEPDQKSLVDPNKYNGVNEEIRTCYGMMPMFLGTGSGSTTTATGTLSFSGLTATVHGGQNKFIEFLQREINLVRAALGISAEVKAKPSRLNLKDEAQFMQVVTQMYMNGLLDHETALDTMGFDPAIISKNMEKLKKLRAKGLFTPTPSANNMGPDGGLVPGKSGAAAQNKPGGKGGTSTGGRPRNQPGGGKNSQKTNKTQAKPTKVAAALRQHNGVTYLVHEGELMPDSVNDVLAALGSDDRERVISSEKYQQISGEQVDFRPPWAMLDSSETVAVTMATQPLLMEAQRLTANRIAELPTEPGKRQYVTAERRADITSTAYEEVGMRHLKQVAGDVDPSMLKRHFSSVTASLEKECKSLSPNDRIILAYAVCAARANKTNSLQGKTDEPAASQ